MNAACPHKIGGPPLTCDQQSAGVSFKDVIGQIIEKHKRAVRKY